jgi:hypothetical protein
VEKRCNDSAGESLGLEEVGTLPAEDAKELSGRVREARQELADEALSKRLATAQFVILGTIRAGGRIEGCRA